MNKIKKFFKCLKYRRGRIFHKRIRGFDFDLTFLKKDCWVGAYFDNYHTYVCIIPCFPLKIKKLVLRERCSDCKQIPEQIWNPRSATYDLKCKCGTMTISAWTNYHRADKEPPDEFYIKHKDNYKHSQ